MFSSVAGVSLALTIAIVLVAGTVVLAYGGTVGAALAIGVALAVAARVLPILGSIGIALWPREGGAPALGFAATAGLVAREMWATVLLFFFFHPFQRLVTRHDPAVPIAGETPIVLVHGFYANAGFWHRIGRRLRDAGRRNVFTLNLQPPFAAIDAYAAQLRARIDEVCDRCGVESVVLVAHSMGGLVARACAARAPGRIRHVICLGTPHAGTVLAALVPAPNTRQMRRGSDWLRQLDTVAAPPVTNIYSEHDNIIIPQDSAAQPGAENIGLTGMGHLEMAFSPALFGVLNDALKKSVDRSST